MRDFLKRLPKSHRATADEFLKAEQELGTALTGFDRGEVQTALRIAQRRSNRLHAFRGSKPDRAVLARISSAAKVLRRDMVHLGKANAVMRDYWLESCGIDLRAFHSQLAVMTRAADDLRTVSKGRVPLLHVQARLLNRLREIFAAAVKRATDREISDRPFLNAVWGLVGDWNKDGRRQQLIPPGKEALLKVWEEVRRCELAAQKAGRKGVVYNSRRRRLPRRDVGPHSS